jgi:hypothetical protein
MIYAFWNEPTHEGRWDFFMVLATAFPFPLPLPVDGPAVAGAVEMLSGVSSVGVFLARLPGEGSVGGLVRDGTGGLARFLPFGLLGPAVEEDLD